MTVNGAWIVLRTPPVAGARLPTLTTSASAPAASALDDDWLERRAVPEVERLGWLHVVVAIVEQVGHVAARARVFGEHHRVAGRVANSCRKADAFEIARGPLGRCPAVGGVVRLCADAGDAQKLGESLA